MVLIKSIRYRHFHALLKLKNSSNYLKNPSQNPYLSMSLTSSNSNGFSLFPPIFWRPFSLSAHFKPKEPKFPEEICLTYNKALSVFFKESIGVLEKTGISGSEAENDGESAELLEKLKVLEEELRSLNKKNENGKGETLKINCEKGDETVRKGVKPSLWAIFADNKEVKLVEPIDSGKEDPRIHKKLSSDMQIFSHHLFKGGYLNDGSFMSNKKNENGKGETLKINCEKGDETVRKGVKPSLWTIFADNKEVKLVEQIDSGKEDPRIHKKLSSDMQIFAHHLFKGGYLNDGSFMSKNMLDLNKLENSHAREFFKFAAVKFGRDHQQITRWLSGSDLKELALFGCPSVGQKTVLAAKRLRSFFTIQEHKVCQKCSLRESCKLENQSVGGVVKLHLSDVTRVLVMYAMESIPSKLVVPEKIKNCVSRLLKEVINLSQTEF